MSKKRNTYRYDLWDGHEKVYIGITGDLPHREDAHRKDKDFDQMKVEGPPVSRETALDWERDALDKYQRGHGGRAPKYNE